MLPLELWRRVALYMSSRDLARGLNQVSKAFRPLGSDAICLCLTDGELSLREDTPAHRLKLYYCKMAVTVVRSCPSAGSKSVRDLASLPDAQQYPEAPLTSSE